MPLPLYILLQYSVISCLYPSEDINLETGMMFIRHKLVKAGDEYVRQEPKTIDSTRRIILP